MGRSRVSQGKSSEKPQGGASKQTPFTAISLFTGAGGLDLGFEAAGFETRVAVEMDEHAVRTLRHNRPEWAVISDDVHSDAASSANILDAARLKPGDADVLIGGPPCQPFSKSGYWAHGDSQRLRDPRASTLNAYLRVLRDVQPKAFLLENVPGLAFNEKSEGVTFLRESIEQINREIGTQYWFEPQFLRAVEFGVPQDRQRVFLVGSRDGTAFQFPSPTHAAPPTLTDAADDDAMFDLFDHGAHAGLEPWITAWDAIGDLEDDDDPSLEMTGKWAGLLPSIPEGQNYLFHTDRGDGLPLFGWRRRYWSFLLKLAKKLPSWTIAAQPGPAIGPFHWKNRRLSRQEMARLQTFPDGFEVLGIHREAQRQIGNAVPSLMAEVLGREITVQLLGAPATTRDHRALAIARRGAPPLPEPVSPVSDEYMPLIGEHEAHPGSGLGYGAERRALRTA